MVDWDHALQLLSDSARFSPRGQDSDLPCAVGLRAMWCWALAHELLRSFRKRSLRPQQLSHTATSGSWQPQLQVLEHARTQLVPPDASMLSSCVGEWRRTWELLRMAQRQQAENDLKRT